MNGVVDSERVAFCFARDDGDREKFVAEPAPASGLDFGHSFHVESLPDLDFSEDAITPYVIGGDLDLLDGLDCEQAVALARELTALALPKDDGSGGGGAPNGEGGAGGDSPEPPVDEAGGAGGADSVPLPDPPALRVGALPAFPAGTLSGGFRHVARCRRVPGRPLVREQEGRRDLRQRLRGWNDARSELRRDVTPGCVQRRVSSAERLTRVGAPRRASLGPLDGVNVPISIADQVIDGKIEPVPANSLYGSFDYGLEDPAVRVRFIDSNGEECAVSWKELLGRGDVDAVEDGKNYVLVALGPRVGIGSESWWNSPTIGIAAADPRGRASVSGRAELRLAWL